MLAQTRVVACHLSGGCYRFLQNWKGNGAIRERTQHIPGGLVGEVRRVVAGARREIDHHHDELEFNLVVRGSGTYRLGQDAHPNIAVTLANIADLYLDRGGPWQAAQPNNVAGKWQIEVACERYEARVQLKPWYDPTNERMK